MDEKQKLKKFIEENPELMRHVRVSSQKRVMYEIMKREEEIRREKDS